MCLFVVSNGQTDMQTHGEAKYKLSLGWIKTDILDNYQRQKYIDKQQLSLDIFEKY